MTIQYTCILFLFVSCQIESTLKRKSAVDRNCIKRFKKDDKDLVVCELCLKHPNIVKMHVYNQKLPKIATENGTAYRADVVESHLTSNYHTECVNAERISLLTKPNKVHLPIDAAVSKASETQASYIGKLMIQIYMDAKALTLSAHSWPARFVANEASNVFQFNQMNESIIPQNLSLRYVNPNKHLELMQFIVNADTENLKSKIIDCLALSIRTDGSVDRVQIDKIYVLGKLITKNGTAELVFLGMDEQTERGAQGLFQTCLNAMTKLLSKDFVYEHILPKVSSICTDGVNTNKGETGGLWFYLQNEIKKSNSKIPLIKIWCVAHRANLTFSDLTKNCAPISDIIGNMSKISSYFRTSGLRTAELKKIASENGLKLIKMPKVYEVRWTEFIYQLFKAVITNWNALILFFNKNPDAQNNGFKIFLTNVDKLKTITFFADVLFIYQRFHKQMQLEFLTLPKFCQYVKNVTEALINLKSNPIPGGFENVLTSQIETKDEKFFLKGIELFEPVAGRRQPLKLEELRKNVIDSLAEYLNIRMESQNESLISTIDAFLKFDKNFDVSEIHGLIGADLAMASLHLQYTDLTNSFDEIKGLSLFDLLKYLCEPSRIDFFSEILTIIARISACTPNSADVERVVSANNNLKTYKRMKLLISTENDYLYIHFNMPSLSQWNPRPAVSRYLAEKNRRQSLQTVESTKTTQRSHFKHVFDEIQEEKDEVVENLQPFRF